MAAEPMTQKFNIVLVGRVLDHAKLRLGNITLKWQLTPSIENDFVSIASYVFDTGWCVTASRWQHGLLPPKFQALAHLRFHEDGFVDYGDLHDTLAGKHKHLMEVIPATCCGAAAMEWILDRARMITHAVHEHRDR